MFKEIHFPSLPSTHLYALENLETLKGQPVFIFADQQTHGIGRKGTPWLSEGGGNLLGTFVYSFAKPFEESHLGQLLCYSSMKMIEQEGLTPFFKWPNDLLLSYKKVGGVMADIRGMQTVISIGLNVNMPRAALDKIDTPSTSLAEEAHHLFDLPTLRKNLCTIFSEDIALFAEKGFSIFFEAFKAKLAFLHKMAKIGNITGEIVGIATDGRLILDTDKGKVLIASGSCEIIGYG